MATEAPTRGRRYEEADAMSSRGGNAGGQRMLPSSIESEKGLICSALLDQRDVLELALAKVAPGQFHVPALSMVWEQMGEMVKQRKPIDIVTVTQWLYDRQLLDGCGGGAMMSELFTYLPTSANWQYYAETLREKFILREQIRIGAQMQRRGYEEQDNAKDMLEDFTNEIVNLSASRNDGAEKIQHVRVYAGKALSEVEQAYASRGGVVGLSTGIADLDRMMGGWQKGRLYYLGGRPAMGKSSLGMNLADYVSVVLPDAEKTPVLIFTLEMTGVQLAKREIFTLAEVNVKRARDGFMGEGDWDKLCTAAAQLGNARLEIDETASLTIADFRARSRAWVQRIRRTHGERTDGRPDALIVVDYLQRMKGSSKRSQDARYLELQEISEGLAITAKDLQVPVVVLAQLKRPKDKKPESTPDMSDFRESGDIEQDADFVGLLHRPIYYVAHSLEKQQVLAAKLEKEFKEKASYQGIDPENVMFTVEDLKRYAMLLVDKQREGPVGPVDLRFIADWTKFEAWDKERPLFSNNRSQRQATEDAMAAAAREEAGSGKAAVGSEEQEELTYE